MPKRVVKSTKSTGLLNEVLEARTRKGLINGNGLTNGIGTPTGALTLHNSSKELINGNGLTNGAGTTSGALTLHNSYGLVNGNGLTNGNVMSRKHHSRELIEFKTRRRLVFNIIVALLLILGPLGIYLIDFNNQESGIQIDEEFEDWDNIVGFHDSAVDQPDNPNINLVEYKADYRNNILSLFLEVYGNVLGGIKPIPTPGARNLGSTNSYGLDNVQIFIDSDAEPNTGYQVGGLGADYMVAIEGYDGRVTTSALNAFATDHSGNDWNGWTELNNIEAGTCDGRLEAKIPIYEVSAFSKPEILIHLQDLLGNEDYSDGILKANSDGMLIITSTTVAPEILELGAQRVPILELDLNAVNDDINLKSISSRLLGTVTDSELKTLDLYFDDNKNGKFELDDSKLVTSKLFNGMVTFNFEPSFQIQAGETVCCFVVSDIPDSAVLNQKTIGLDIPNRDYIKLETVGALTLTSNHKMSYIGNSPDSIVIDGAFADWKNSVNYLDTDISSIKNENIDLSEYRISVEDDALSFYFKVEGAMMGGTSVPIIPKLIPLELQVPSISTSETLIHENSVKPPATTIPPELIGNDCAYIFIDNDENIATGLNEDWLPVNLGADYMIKITGRNGKILNQELYEYDQLNFDWQYLSKIEAGKDNNRLEIQLELGDIISDNFNDFQIWFVISDWNNDNRDLSDGLVVKDNNNPDKINGFNTRANNPYISKTIHPKSAQNSDSEGLDPLKLDELAPGDAVYEVSGDTNEPNPDWIEVTFAGANISNSSKINNITYYYGYYTNDGWNLTTDLLSNITWRIDANQYNITNYTLSSPPDTDIDTTFAQVLGLPSAQALNSGDFSVRFRGLENGSLPDYFYLDYCYVKINYSVPEIVLNEILFNSSGGMYSPNWQYRKQITLNASLVEATLANFTVLINLVDPDLKKHARADGYDILFTLADGVTKLSHEIEYYNDTTGKLVAWVKFPNLDNVTDTAIYMYYGNANSFDQQNVTGAWDSNYQAIWHLAEVPTGAYEDIKDSTSNNNNGTTEGSVNAIRAVDAKFGKGLEFTEVDGRIRINDSASLDSVNDSATIQLWIWWDNAADGDHQFIMSSSNRFTAGFNDGFELASQGDGDHFFYPWGGHNENYNLGLNPFTNQNWHHLVATMEYSTKEVKIYIDGNPMSFTYTGVPINWTQLAEPNDWLWGGNPDRVTRYFDGMFDEIRVSDTVRSIEWIKTEFNNHNSTIDFYNVGAEESHEWVEIYNDGNNAIDLTGWKLTDHDGNSFNLSGAGVIPANGYLVCHLGVNGVNSSSHVYGPIINSTSSPIKMLEHFDDLALIDCDDRIIDYVAWGADASADDDGAANAGQWDDGDFVALTGYSEGDTLARDYISTDSDQPADWENSCGINSSKPSPGYPNIPEFEVVLIPIIYIFIMLMLTRKRMRRKFRRLKI